MRGKSLKNERVRLGGACLQILDEPVDQEGGFIVQTAIGGSMFPTIKHLDEVLFIKISPLKIKKRDIVLFRDEGKDLICHRVIRMEVLAAGNIVLCLQGDSNKEVNRVSADRILGKVVGRLRNDQLKWFALENSFLYCFALRAVRSCNDFCKTVFEKICGFRISRKILKEIFILQPEYILKMGTREDMDFISFCCSPSRPENDEFFKGDFGFVAMIRKNPVGKIWISGNIDGNILFFGPHVKPYFRGRGIGAELVRKAVLFAQERVREEKIFVVADAGGPLLGCYQRAGFLLEKAETIFPRMSFASLYGIKKNLNR